MNIKEYEQLKEKAIRQFKKGEPLFGKGGAFTPILKSFLEEALNAEMDEFLNPEQRKNGNKRNGAKTKKIKSGEGTFVINTPQARKMGFEPQTIPKHETILADNLEKQIIELYAQGNSYRNISKYIKKCLVQRFPQQF